MAHTPQNRDKYPPFNRKRISLSDALSSGGGPVAGRLRGRILKDDSASCTLDIPSSAPEGALVSGILLKDTRGWSLQDVTVHAPCLLCHNAGDEGLEQIRSTLEKRHRLLDATREFFCSRAFLHVETPIRVITPAVEPHLSAFSAGDRFLATSPELHLKKLLSAGYERIFEIARVFRQEELGRQHLPEFTMLEWYRAWGNLDVLMEDCEQLIYTLADRVCRPAPPLPFPRITYRDLFIRFAGLDPFADQSPDYLAGLRERVSDAGGHPTQTDNSDDLLEHLFVHAVEPHVASLGAVFVTDFPSHQAALARVHATSEGTVAKRFELYLDGLEIANAFDELTDPREQRDRIRADMDKRRARAGEVYPEDISFLRALDMGMPPSAGIALGFDRLLMWLLGASRIQDVVAFPYTLPPFS